MTMTHSPRVRRKVDVASLALLLIGLAFGVLARWLIVNHGSDPIILAPSVVAATLGATNLLKREAR